MPTIDISSRPQFEVSSFRTSHVLEFDFNGYHFSTFYILPLLEINAVTDFYHFSNIHNTYLSKKNELIVQVRRKTALTKDLTKHPCYKYDIDVEVMRAGRICIDTFFVFSIPKIWNEDIEKFWAGRFDLFSKKAVENIKKYSISFLKTYKKENLIFAHETYWMTQDKNALINALCLAYNIKEDVLPEAIIGIPNPEIEILNIEDLITNEYEQRRIN